MRHYNSCTGSTSEQQQADQGVHALSGVSGWGIHTAAVAAELKLD